MSGECIGQALQCLPLVTTALCHVRLIMVVTGCAMALKILVISMYNLLVVRMLVSVGRLVFEL